MLHFFPLQNSKRSSEPTETLNPKIALPSCWNMRQNKASGLLKITQYSHSVLERRQGETQPCDTERTTQPLAFPAPTGVFPTHFAEGQQLPRWIPSSTTCTLLTPWQMAQNLQPCKRGSSGLESTSTPAGDGFRTCLVTRSQHHGQTHHLSLTPEQDWGNWCLGRFCFLCSPQDGKKPLNPHPHSYIEVSRMGRRIKQLQDWLERLTWVKIIHLYI